MTLYSIAEAVEAVRREKIRGARWSLYTLAKAVIEDIERGSLNCNNMQEAAELIISANRSMAPLANLAYVLEKSCERGIDPLNAVRRIIEHQQRSMELIREFGHQVPEKSRITTISYSSSVEAILLASKTRTSTIIVLESRPGGEGAILAATLRDAGLTTRLIPDSMAYVAIETSDFILVGADAVTRDACLINKIGTRQVALLAKYLSKPIIAVFDTLKIHPKTTCNTHPIEERSYIAPGYGPIRYPLFDKTEPQLISKAVTEKGIVDYKMEVLENIWRETIEEILSPG